MSWGYQGWRPYVTVAKRRAKAARELARLAKRCGRAASPVVLDGRKIASTFWGRAWCDNLEAYSDYENRLPRGRTYVRNGSVVDLQIGRGNVAALVSGSELYRIEIKIEPLAPGLWRSIQKECAGKIDSLIELLQGKLSSAVMQIVTRRERGLFPTPKEIDLDCSCPDWADLCKHVAASLYGVGAKLDQNPELLFLLRGVDPTDLISKASAAEALRQTTATAGGTSVMSEAEVADVFGIEMEPGSAASVPAFDVPVPPPPTAAPTLVSAPSPAPRRRAQRKPHISGRLSEAVRARIAAIARARWAKIKRSSTAKPGSEGERRRSAAAKAGLSALAQAKWARTKKEDKVAL
jgi:uncharacterized Zn finger protein